MAELKIKADSGGGTVSFKGPSTTTSNAAVQLTLPVDDGTANQYLKTDGSGALSWATVASSPVTALNNATANELVTVGSTTTELDAESGLTFDGTHLTIGDGDLVIGTSGHGIDFSADGDSTNASGTASAHLLHDYEEGTFDPEYRTGVTSYTERSGHYTKVGRVVHYQLYVNAVVDSTSSTSLAIVKSLPFTCHSATNISSSACIGWWYGLGEDVTQGYVNATTTEIVLLGENHSGSRDHVTHNEVFQSQSSAKICISGSYITAA